MNMYIIPIEKNVLGRKPSGCEREHSLLEDCPKECNHSLMMRRIRYVYSFFYLDYHFTPEKFLSTQVLPGIMKPWPGVVCAAVLRCSMKIREV